MAAILATTLVLGVVAIAAAHPFGGQSVSGRISDAIGRPASCTSVGATQFAGRNQTIYKCTIGLDQAKAAQCFTVSGDTVRQIGGTRRFGC
jgi:hypothetical protein